MTRTGYGVSKAAHNNLTCQIALQFARDGIRCNAVLPGLTATDAALDNMPEEFIRSFLSHVPLNRMGRPEDIAGAVLFLAGDDASYITGHILDVAGGYGLGYAPVCRRDPAGRGAGPDGTDRANRRGGGPTAGPPFFCLLRPLRRLRRATDFDNSLKR